jgi:opacity protein-like surface antigen
MRSLKTLALTGLLSAAASQGVHAADLFGPFSQPEPEAISAPVEIGSGWYLRGDANWKQEHQAQLSADIAQGLTKKAWSVDLGAGYKFNNWFRADLTVGFNKLQNNHLIGADVTCPYQLTGLTSQGANPVELGYLWDTTHDTCSPQQSVHMRRIDVLLNGYVDLGTYVGVTPYVGAGIGVSSLHTSGGLNYYKTSDGSVYGADLTPTGTYPHIWVDAFGNPIAPQPTVGFAKQNWAKSLTKSSYNLAWALMFGFAYDLTDHAKIDIGYRYLNAGTYKSAVSPVTGRTVTSTIHSQEVRVGFRYMID